MTPIRVQWNCGRTAAGMRIHLDLVRNGEAGTFALWVRDGEELYRAGTWSFDGYHYEMDAACAAQLAVEDLLRGGEADDPPRWFAPDVLAACAADPIRDEPGAFL